jgi:hypothetical protein
MYCIYIYILYNIYIYFYFSKSASQLHVAQTCTPELLNSVHVFKPFVLVGQSFEGFVDILHKFVKVFHIF